MEDRGYQLGNLDATIIAQKPKLSPFKEQIRNNLASLLGAHPSVINLMVSRPLSGLHLIHARNMRFRSTPKGLPVCILKYYISHSEHGSCDLRALIACLAIIACSSTNCSFAQRL